MSKPPQFETEADHLASGLSALAALCGSCQDFPPADDMYSLLTTLEQQARRCLLYTSRCV